MLLAVDLSRLLILLLCLLSDAAHPSRLDIPGNEQIFMGSVVARQHMSQGQGHRNSESDQWAGMQPHPVGVPRLVSASNSNPSLQFPYSIQTSMFFGDESGVASKKPQFESSDIASLSFQMSEEFQNLEATGHRLVRNTGPKYKPCVLCQLKKVRTKSGWYVNTYFKCLACDVPLCKSPIRDCFRHYHTYIGDPGK